MCAGEEPIRRRGLQGGQGGGRPGSRARVACEAAAEIEGSFATDASAADRPRVGGAAPAATVVSALLLPPPSIACLLAGRSPSVSPAVPPSPALALPCAASAAVASSAVAEPRSCAVGVAACGTPLGSPEPATAAPPAAAPPPPAEAAFCFSLSASLSFRRTKNSSGIPYIPWIGISSDSRPGNVLFTLLTYSVVTIQVLNS